MVKLARAFVGTTSLIAGLCCAAAGAGCNRMQMNRIVVTDHRSDGAPREHFEDFQRGFYRLDANGMVDLVLHKPPPPDRGATQGAEQLVHIHTYWTATPGRTHAQGSMLNSRVSYCVVRGDSAISFDGGGFVHYKINEKAKTIRGVLQGADLQPLRRSGGDLEIFERATIAGRFRATHNPRQTARLLQRIERWLGSLPAIEPDRASPVL